ncbi:hypothetical protein Tco_0959435 [Tanacetum coccineum]
MGDAIAQTRFERASKQSYDSPLRGVNTPRSDEDKIELKELMEIFRIKSSAEKSLGDQEDAFKQRRNEINQEEGISYINITTAEHVITASAPVATAGVSVSTAKPSTPPPTTTTFIEDEDLTIAQTLMKMRSVKSKEKSKKKGVSSETATRLTRGVIMKEASETDTRPIVPPPP